MGRWLKIAGGLAWGVLICLQAGCRGPGTIPPSPSWHQLKSGCYDTVEGRFFYGIGRATGVRNATLLRATADNRARKELDVVLEQYVLELARSVPGDLGPDWARLALGERRQVLGMVVRKAMRQAVVWDHWNESPEGEMLSLCRLSLPDFILVLSTPGILDDPMRSAMVSAAERVHARLARRL